MTMNNLYSTSSRSSILLLTIVAFLTSSHAFTVFPSTNNGPTFAPSLISYSTVNSNLHAGFGGGGAGKKGKKGKGATPIKLKPKQQWDRYGALKKDTFVKVGVRVVGDGSEWFEVGKIKSEDDKYTSAAVSVQRGLIAEHAKRLYPLQIKQKDVVEWGMSSKLSPEQGDWEVVDHKEVLSADTPKGIEKMVGFEGKPDAATGFYCHYEDGRLVDKYGGQALAKE